MQWISNLLQRFTGLSTATPCCPRGSEPILPAASEYTPRGKTISLQCEESGKFISVYISPPPKPSSVAILVAHDIGGPFTGRHKEVCDQFADQGYWVALPNLFQESMPLKFPPWYKFPFLFPTIYRNMTRPWKEIEQEVGKVIGHLVVTEKVERIGLLGFCYGAFTVFKAGGERFTQRHHQVKCGVSMHPSVHSCAFFKGENKWDIVKSVCVPQMVLSTKWEPADWRPGGKVESILAQKGELPEQSCTFKIFPNQRHGFFTRGDIQKENVKKDVDKAFDLTLEFFHRYL